MSKISKPTWEQQVNKDFETWMRSIGQAHLLDRRQIKLHGDSDNEYLSAGTRHKWQAYLQAKTEERAKAVRHFCNKCGYVGHTAEHEGCAYLAGQPLVPTEPPADGALAVLGFLRGKEFRMVQDGNSTGFGVLLPIAVSQRDTLIPVNMFVDPERNEAVAAFITQACNGALAGLMLTEFFKDWGTTGRVSSSTNLVPEQVKHVRATLEMVDDALTSIRQARGHFEKLPLLDLRRVYDELFEAGRERRRGLEAAKDGLIFDVFRAMSLHSTSKTFIICAYPSTLRFLVGFFQELTQRIVRRYGSDIRADITLGSSADIIPWLRDNNELPNLLVAATYPVATDTAQEIVNSMHSTQQAWITDHDGKIYSQGTRQ